MVRVIVLSLLLTAPLGAQTYPCGTDAQTSIATDRPQIANSSIVVPCGSLQLENGFQATGSSGQRAWDLPETAIRLGILHRTELRLAVPDYFFNASATPRPATGLGDLTLGLKQQIGPFKGIDLSIIPSLSLPTGAAKLSSHGYDPALQIPWSRALGKNWTLAGQLAGLWPTQPSTGTGNGTGKARNPSGQASLYFDRQLTPRLDAYAEYSGQFPSHGGPQHSLDFGAAFKPTPHQQLDIHGGPGLSTAAADYTIGLGYSVRFQIVHGR